MRRCHLAWLVAGCTHGLAADPLVPEPAVTPRPSAEQVLADMTATYANATSYGDFGVVTVTLGNDEHEASADHSFRTDFVRPRLRFEVTDSAPSSYVLWSDGEQSLTESSAIAGRVGKMSLELGLRDADEASYSVSRWVPTYLAGVPGRLPLGDPEVTGEDSVGGHDCWIVSASSYATAYRLEIDKASHLVRRLARMTHAPGNSVTLTELISYEPVLDDPEVEVEPMDIADKTIVSDLRSR
jgi:hypothetical protein